MGACGRTRLPKPWNAESTSGRLRRCFEEDDEEVDRGDVPEPEPAPEPTVRREPDADDRGDDDEEAAPPDDRTAAPSSLNSSLAAAAAAAAKSGAHGTGVHTPTA